MLAEMLAEGPPRRVNFRHTASNFGTSFRRERVQMRERLVATPAALFVFPPEENRD